MSKMQHSAGPWKIAEDGSPFVYALNAHGYNRFYLGVQAGDDDSKKRVSLSELKSNARLIAAAPDLYKLVNRLANPDEGELLTLEDYRNIARAVLAKAKGE